MIFITLRLGISAGVTFLSWRIRRMLLATLFSFVTVTHCTECLLFRGRSGNVVTFGG